MVQPLPRASIARRDSARAGAAISVSDVSDNIGYYTRQHGSTSPLDNVLNRKSPNPNNVPRLAIGTGYKYNCTESRSNSTECCIQRLSHKTEATLIQSPQTLV